MSENLQIKSTQRREVGQYVILSNTALTDSMINAHKITVFLIALLINCANAKGEQEKGAYMIEKSPFYFAEKILQ